MFSEWMALNWDLHNAHVERTTKSSDIAPNLIESYKCHTNVSLIAHQWRNYQEELIAWGAFVNDVTKQP